MSDRRPSPFKTLLDSDTCTLIEAAEAGMRALHERVEFVAQSEIQGEFASGLPAIARVPTELPFPSSHFDVLQGFSGRLLKAEQKCRVPVELIGRGAAALSGDSAVKSK